MRSELESLYSDCMKGGGTWIFYISINSLGNHLVIRRWYTNSLNIIMQFAFSEVIGANNAHNFLTGVDCTGRDGN